MLVLEAGSGVGKVAGKNEVLRQPLLLLRAVETAVLDVRGYPCPPMELCVRAPV